MTEPPLVIRRLRTTLGFTWFGEPTPSQWWWECRLCNAQGNDYRVYAAALGDALGHLAVWHTPSPLPR